jgi:predicted amidophosphoribosyltransferase
MIEPWGDIGEERNDYWDEDNLSLSLFVYKSRADTRANRFILRFKEYDIECVSDAVDQLRDALKRHIDDWNKECRYIVPVPSHEANIVSRSSVYVCLCIAGTSHLEYPERLLFRRTTVLSHLNGSRQRPTVQEHFESLACRSADLGGATVLLFDDVRTTGNTSQACRCRLQEDVNAGQVVRLFRARVEL